MATSSAFLRRNRRSGAARRGPAARIGLAIAATALVVVGLPLGIGLTSGAGATPATDGNGDLAPSCGLDVTLVLDDSGSISSSEANQVRSAAQTFASALTGTPSRLKTIVFASRATGVASNGSLTSNLSNIVFRDPADYTAPTSGGGSGGTNWDDALETVRRSNGGPGDLVVFVTDGDPTYRNSSSPDGHANDGSHSLGGDGSTIGVAANLNNAVAEADLLKDGGSGTHMLGVGIGFTSASSEQRLNDVTGDDEMTITAGTPDIAFGEADYTVTPNFSELQGIVSTFARELCADSLNVTKYEQKADGTTAKAGAGSPWSFTATLDPAPSSWTSPATGSGASATLATDENGGASFVWDQAANVTGHALDITEAPKAGWVYNGARCTRNDLEGGEPEVVLNTVGTNQPGASRDPSELTDLMAKAGEALNCDIYNRQERPATIQVLKTTSPSGLPGDFGFTLSHGQATVDQLSGISDGETGTFDPVPAGTYRVVEDPAPGFVVDSASCDDLGTGAVETVDPAQLTVAEGSTWRCHVVNAATPGSITVTKVAKGADGTFAFTSNVPGLGGFSITTSNGSGSSAKTTVPVGTYTLAETVPARWHLDGATCTGGDDPAAIHVAPGEDVTCTFTNSAPDPSISVTKTPSPTTVAEPGGVVSYAVTVMNTSVEPVWVSSISDSIEGGPDLDLTAVAGPITSTTCATGGSIAAGATYQCAFTTSVHGNGGDTVSDLVTVHAMDGQENDASATAGAAVAITNVAPTLSVTKTPTVASIAEPGGSLTYDVSITNTSTESVIVDSIVDAVEGGTAFDVTQVAAPVAATDCDDLLGGALAPSGTVTCSFTVDQVVDRSDVPDGYLDDTVTVTAHDDDVAPQPGAATNTTVTASASAKVAVTDVPPAVVVTKTATPSTVAETGPGQTRSVSYLVTIQNTSPETVTIDSILDAVDGAPAAAAGGTCPALVGTTLAAQASTSCTFTGLVAGDAGGTTTDVATVTVSDDDGNTANDDDDATVTFTDLPSSIAVDKAASVGSVPEPGAPVTYTVTITNTSSADSVTLGSIVDAVDGGPAGAVGGTCAARIGTVLVPGGSTTCTFTMDVTGDAGATVADTVTVTGTDDDGATVSDDGSETVAITDVGSSLAVDKEADVASVPEPGGPVTYTLTLHNTSTADSITLDSIVDAVDGGPDAAVAGTCAAKVGTSLAAGASTTCTFTMDVTGNAGDAVDDTVTVSGTDDDGGAVSAKASEIVDLTDVASSLAVDKAASVASVPEPGGSVTYTVTITNTSDADALTLDGIVDSVDGGPDAAAGGTCASLVGTSLDPGADTSCTFARDVTGNAGDTVPDTVTVTAHDDEQNALSAKASEIVDITDVLPTATLTKDADPSTLPETGGSVTYTVGVTNTSPAEAVTLTTLVDEIDGTPHDLTAVAAPITATTCATGGVIAAGDTYTCTFTASIAAGQAGDELADTVTATLVDDEDNAVTPSDTETVTLTDVAPTITVTKDNGGARLAAPGGDVDFDVTVTNASAEAVTLTGLVDSVDGGAPIDLAAGAAPLTATTCATGGIIAAGGSYSCSFTLPVASDEATSVPDEVTATAVDDDGTSVSAGDDAVTTVTASADLAIAKKRSSPPLVPGNAGAYRLTVTNAGPSTAAQPVVVDRLPAGLGAFSAEGDGWGCTVAPRVVRCERASLARGATSTITIKVRVAASAAGKELTNVADVTATTPDPELANNHAEVTDLVGAVAPDDTDRNPTTTTTTPNGTHAGNLARTGSDVEGLLWAGLLLVGLGGCVLAVRRLTLGGGRA